MGEKLGSVLREGDLLLTIYYWKADRDGKLVALLAYNAAVETGKKAGKSFILRQLHGTRA